MTNYVFKFPNVLQIVKVKIVVVKFVNPTPWRGEKRDSGVFLGGSKKPAFKKKGASMLYLARKNSKKYLK
jgi:hypothetical protein